MADIQIFLNGEPRFVPEGTDLGRMLEIFSLPVQRVAIELNKSVVRRVEWPEASLSDGDRIEVVHFVGGG
jgi:thiamine biosynthesis protein ThiS